MDPITNKKPINYLIIIFSIFFSSHIFSVFAIPKINKDPIVISYLAYSEFSKEYVYSGEISAPDLVWMNQDDTLSIYESSKLYQYDADLNLKNIVEIKEISSPVLKEDSTKTDLAKNKNLKIILSADNKQTYYLIKKEYTTKERDLKEIQEKISEIKIEEKEYIASLQTLATDEQKERNKLDAKKSLLSASQYTNQLNEIKKNLVEKRYEIEKKMIKLFRKQNELDLKNALIKNKKNIIEIQIIDNSKNIEIKNFIFPENFWGINIFELESLTIDASGVFYGYKKDDNRIYIFDFTCELLSSFIIDFSPQKILVDKNQNIYIANLNKISQFKPTGFARGYLQPINNNLNVIGSIMEETTWSGTVNITGETRVEPGAILNILPGTKIVFSKGIAKLNIFGTVRASGKKDSYIIFTSDTPYPFGEINIYADNQQEASIFSFCRFEAMQYALRIYDSSPEITHSIFTSNEDGIWYQSSNQNFITKCLITKNTIKNNLVGVLFIFLISGNNPSFEYNNIYENKRSNFVYKNKEPLKVNDNFWGIEDIDKITKTITIESKEDEKIDVILHPVLPIPFDITVEE